MFEAVAKVASQDMLYTEALSQLNSELMDITKVRRGNVLNFFTCLIQVLSHCTVTNSQIKGSAGCTPRELAYLEAAVVTHTKVVHFL